MCGYKIHREGQKSCPIELSPRERVLCALNHQEPDRVPFDLWAVPETKTRLMNFFATDNYEDVLLALKSDLRVIEPDYVGPKPERFSDGSYCDIWGTHRKLVKNKFGSYEEYASFPLATVETIKDIEAFHWTRSEWWDVSTLADRIQALNQSGPFYIRYEVGGIFELGWGLRGLEQFLIDLALWPEIPYAIMKRITDIYVENVHRVFSAAKGTIDMAYTYDDIGTQEDLLVSLSTWRELIRPHHVRLNEAIKEYGVTLMYHSCGAIYSLIEELIEIGIDVLNPLQPRARGMDLKAIKKNFGDKISFHGGIDLQHTLPIGTPEEVRAEARNRKEVLGQRGGYILAPAHYVQADTPIENILAMYDEVVARY